MMNRIINTMFHGSTKARIFLWSVFIMGLATILLGVMAAALGSFTFGTGAFVCGLAAFVTSQSASLTEMERRDKQEKNKKEKDRKKKTKEPAGRNDSAGKSEEENDGGKDVWYSKEKEKAKMQYLSSMNAKKLKNLAKEHKVKQKHVFAMVDMYPAEKIRQAPAIVWRTDTHLHLLIMDQSAKEFQIPFNDIQGIYYDKNVTADPDRDYVPFQYSGFMSKIYKPYLPEYKENTKDGQMIYVKNLFTIHPGISFTNTSMKGIFSILTRAPFLVDDAINTSDRFDEYFKDIYRYGILCKNNIYSLEEYRQKLESVLEELLAAPITREEFFRTLNAMNHYHLITQDYVMKYTQKYVIKNNETN